MAHNLWSDCMGPIRKPASDMRKIIAGFVLAIILGVPAIYFGVPLWAEHRARQRVDATFASLALSFGKASYGAVSYDAWARTLKIEDVAVQSSDSDGTSLKASQVVIVGADELQPGRMAADRIDIANAEIAGLRLGSDGPRTTYRMPKIAIERFAGPTSIERRPTAIAGAQTLLALFEAAAATNAAEIAIPALSATVAARARGGSRDENLEYELSDLRLHDLSAGRITSTTIDHLALTGNVPETGSYTAEIEKLAASDVDLSVMLPILDPAQRKDDGYRTVYRNASSGPYRISFNKSSTVRFDSVRLEDFALRPSKFSDLAMSNVQGLAASSPAEAKALGERLASVYEGIRIARFEAQGIEARLSPMADAKAATIRLTTLEDGHVAELAIDGLDARSAPAEPLKIKHAALKDIDLARIARNAARVPPGGAQAMHLLEMFRGVEIEGMKIPPQGTRSQVQIDTLSASWGKFAGLIPPQIRISSKIQTPIDPTTADPGLRLFADGESKTLTIGFDLGAAWDKTTQTLAISPVSADIPGLYSATARMTLNNAPPALFSSDPAAVVQASTQLELGRIELSLRDLGGIEVMLTKIAKERQMSAADVRKSLAQTARALAATNPDLQTLAAAVARLLDTSGRTLNIALVPKQRLRIADAIDVGRTLPAALLSQFDIEAGTDK